METPRPISERSFEQLLSQAISARAEGLVALRDREGLRHGVWVQDGYALGVLVAGRFDPLLGLLRQRGALSAHSHERCLRALQETRARSGALANAAGVAGPQIRDALRLQVVARFGALLEIARSQGFDAALERRAVPCDEQSVRMPLGCLYRGITRQTAARDEEARQRLRRLAKQLHPDRHPHLDPAMRARLAAALADATASYHGLA